MTLLGALVVLLHLRRCYLDFFYIDKLMQWLYAGLSCTICQFWLFTGQCKSIANNGIFFIHFWKESGDLHG